MVVSVVLRTSISRMVVFVSVLGCGQTAWRQGRTAGPDLHRLPTLVASVTPRTLGFWSGDGRDVECVLWDTLQH